MTNIQVRKANNKDCPFLAEMILQSESTGFEVITFKKMFGFSDQEMIDAFTQVLNNETTGHPLTYSSYYIATINGERCGAISSYIEGESGDSNLQMANCMMASLDRKLVMKGFMFSKENSETIIPKSKNYQQIDCVATVLKHRGKGIFRKIFEHISQEFQNRESEGIEVQVWKNNPAVNVYEKFGFTIIKEHTSSSEEGKAKLLMTKIN